MTEVKEIRYRWFRILNDCLEHGYGYDFKLEELKKGDHFRADDDPPSVIWEATGDPYLNADNIWTINAECVAG